MRLFAVLLLLASAPLHAQIPAGEGAAHAPRPRNVVFMIADGFGPASEALARAANGRPLALDAILTGAVSTAATDSRVTDSAAAATAYACGITTYNGAIGVGPDGTPCQTVLEAARDAGLAVGLVATSRITHATPAAYASHVPRRADEAAIAAQMAEARLDVMIGGGGRFFVPESAGGSRTDGRDLRRDLLARGALVTTTRAGLDRFPAAPAVALLAPDHMAYEIDRDETDEPALAAMATRALDLLAATPAARANGFFLMVEGSRIDHAGHANDAPAHVRDILAYDAAVAAVLDWARRDGATLVVSTADHETGGLTLGRDGVYAFEPAALMAVTMSADRLDDRLDGPGADVDAIVRDALGTDSLTSGESARLAATPDTDERVAAFRDIASRRAGVAWTTSGHTGVDVGLYAFGPGADAFRGAMTNDAVGRATFSALGLPLPPAAQAAADAEARAL
jgi:alkaline phosphatase